jgi:ferredoxin
MAYFVVRRLRFSLDDELHCVHQSFGGSIQLTRKSNESDRETSKEEQESRTEQKARAQDAADVCPQFDGELVSDKHRSKF